MVERAGDTRTTAPAFIYENPWGFKLDMRAAPQAGNFVDLAAGTNTSFYQNFGKFAYYIEGEYLYYSRNWVTLRQRARGTARADFTLARLSEDFQLSLPVFVSGAYDNILLLEPRITAGGGLWLDYKPEDGILHNGFSVFATGEWERASGLPDDSAVRASFRNLSTLSVNDQDTTRLRLDLFFAPNVVDVEDFRASAALGVETDLSDILNLNFSGISEYDSEPRISTIKKYDIGALLTFGVRLGPKKH